MADDRFNVGELWDGVEGETEPVLVTGVADPHEGSAGAVTFVRLSAPETKSQDAFAGARRVGEPPAPPARQVAPGEAMERVAKALLMFERARTELVALELPGQPTEGLDFVRNAISAASNGCAQLGGFRSLQDYLREGS